MLYQSKVKYFNIKGQLRRKADLDVDIWFYLWKLRNKFTSFWYLIQTEILLEFIENYLMKENKL